MANEEIGEVRRCSKCHQTKPATQEFFNRYTHGRLKRQCRVCTASARKAWAIAKSNGADFSTIVCDRCEGVFEKASNSQLRCVACRAMVAAETERARKGRYTYNPEYAKKYYARNAVKVQSYGAGWYRRRRENMTSDELADYRKRNAASTKSRRQRNPLHFRVHDAMRKSLRGEYRSHKLEAILGYSIETLARHLERQFLPGMSWSNIGKWHVDHILPQSMFRFTSSKDVDFKLCWALANLRPLWAKDNVKKNASRQHLL
jgi:hypothetical protein